MDDTQFEPQNIADLASDLLGLDPLTLASMAGLPLDAAAEPSPDQIWAGLNEFARRLLMGYLALADFDGAAVRLKDEAAARANGWPNALIANKAMVLIWALLVEDRELKALSEVPLLEADPQHEAADHVLDTAGAMSTIDLCRMVTPGITLTEDMQQQRARGIAAAASGPMVVSTNAAIKSILGLDTAQLERAIDTRDAPTLDAEKRGRIGLNVLVRRALRQYEEMHEHNVDEIRLMTEKDAREGNHPDARSANTAMLISAALMSEEGWDVVVYPPRDHGPQYEDLLQRVAAFVVRDGSRQSGKALEALCRRDVHLGQLRGEQKHNRLLWDAMKQLKEGKAD